MSRTYRKEVSDETITTGQWMKAGLPFEWWLRYSQAKGEVQRKTEALFNERFPNIVAGGN